MRKGGRILRIHSWEIHKLKTMDHPLKAGVSTSQLRILTVRLLMLSFRHWRKLKQKSWITLGAKMNYRTKSSLNEEGQKTMRMVGI